MRCTCVPCGPHSVSVSLSILVSHPSITAHIIISPKRALENEQDTDGSDSTFHLVEPQPAMIRKSRHRIWLRDLQPYVFCDRYSARRQRKGKADAFELYFVHEEAATRFKQAIGPPINTATESSDNVTVESDI